MVVQCSVSAHPGDPLFFSFLSPTFLLLPLLLPRPLRFHPPSPVPKDKRLFEGLVVRSRGEKGATPRWCQSCPFHAR